MVITEKKVLDGGKRVLGRGGFGSGNGLNTQLVKGQGGAGLKELFQLGCGNGFRPTCSVCC